MKNARPQESGTSAGTAPFYPVDNPRERRFLEALLRRAELRSDLDRLSGSANSPDLAFRLRAKGFSLPCERIEIIDRDGLKARVGIYSLSAADRPKAIAALNGRG